MVDNEQTATGALPVRQLVVCCDGTNNTLTGGAGDTNVVRLYQMLAAQPQANRVIYYDSGVGAPSAVPPTSLSDLVGNAVERLTELASGKGVYENIAQAYIFLMRHWRGPQDQIYLFGFSRGAFTARAVAGMVHLFGIIRPEHEAMVSTLVNIYFSPTESATGKSQRAARWLHKHLSNQGQAAPAVDAKSKEEVAKPKEKVDPRGKLAEQAKQMFGTLAGNSAWVYWVGVWDTVESVGLLGRGNPSVASLHDKHTHHVRHALALDEHRWTFLPRLYEEPGDIDGVTQQGEPQTLKQRWFPGVHCDAGGSYVPKESALSESALEWMVGELRGHLYAAPLPKPLPPLEAPARALRHDPLWDTPWWALAGMTVRNMRPHVAGTGKPMAVKEYEPVPQTIGSVWDKRRGFVPLLVAALLALLCLVLSGMCLLPAHEQGIGPQALGRAVWAACCFAQQQLLWLWTPDLLASGVAPWLPATHPGWAMFWDLLFILAYGYLLARIASRAFTAMVGLRKPGDTLPVWLKLGLAPLLAVVADAGEDLFTLCALAAHAVGTDWVGLAFLWATSLASLLKLVGLAGCGILLLVRLVLVVKPGLGGAGLRRHSVETSPPTVP